MLWRAGVIRRPACYQSCWELHRKPAEHTAGSWSPSWRRLQTLDQTASRCIPLQRYMTHTDDTTTRDTGQCNAHTTAVHVNQSHVPSVSWTIWKFFTDAWVTRPWKLSTYDCVSTDTERDNAVHTQPTPQCCMHVVIDDTWTTLSITLTNSRRLSIKCLTAVLYSSIHGCEQSNNRNISVTLSQLSLLPSTGQLNQKQLLASSTTCRQLMTTLAGLDYNDITDSVVTQYTVSPRNKWIMQDTEILLDTHTDRHRDSSTNHRSRQEPCCATLQCSPYLCVSIVQSVHRCPAQRPMKLSPLDCLVYSCIGHCFSACQLNSICISCCNSWFPIERNVNNVNM